MSGYTKLFGIILDSTVWETSLPVKITWITMLAMADQDGIVEASVPSLAKRAGVTREDCEAALALFLAPDPDSRTREYDGRRIEVVDGGWRLLNHSKYRHRASLEDIRLKAAERQRRWRQAKKAECNVTVTENNGSNDIASAPASPSHLISLNPRAKEHRADARSVHKVLVRIAHETLNEEPESVSEAIERLKVIASKAGIRYKSGDITKAIEAARVQRG